MQPMEIFVDDDTKLTLHGLQQYYIRLEEKVRVCMCACVYEPNDQL